MFIQFEVCSREGAGVGVGTLPSHGRGGHETMRTMSRDCFSKKGVTRQNSTVVCLRRVATSVTPCAKSSCTRGW